MSATRAICVDATVAVVAGKSVPRAECRHARDEPKTLHEHALDALMAYQWPGNVRELENAPERAVIFSSGDVIGVDALPERVTERRAEPLVSDRVPATPTIEAIERAYIQWVLTNECGNKSRAADMLGIDTSMLYRKRPRYEGRNRPSKRQRKELPYHSS